MHFVLYVRNDSNWSIYWNPACSEYLSYNSNPLALELTPFDLETSILACFCCKQNTFVEQWSTAGFLYSKKVSLKRYALIKPMFVGVIYSRFDDVSYYYF